MPLLVRGELVGVLVIESETPYRFHEDDKQTIELLGAYLAMAIQNAVLQEGSDAAEPRAIVPPAAAATPAGRTAALDLAYYRADDVVMVDGEYLIRGLPARILWKLVTIHAADGRAEFTNRELRLDKTLQLPEYKDNLETRLLLLRRRLEQKCPALQIVPRGRGRFALVTTAAVSLVERP